MLEQIIQLVQQQASDYFVGDAGVPNEQAGAAAQAAGESIFEVIQNQILSGNMGAVQDLLGVGQSGNTPGGNDAMSAIMQQAVAVLGGKLMNQGVSQQAAQSASANIMPTLMNMVLGSFRSPAPADAGFDVGSLIGLVLGGSGGNQNTQNNNPLGGLGSILGNILG